MWEVHDVECETVPFVKNMYMYYSGKHVHCMHIGTHVHCMHIGTPVGATYNHLDRCGLCRFVYNVGVYTSLHNVTFIYMYM